MIIIMVCQVRASMHAFVVHMYIMLLGSYSLHMYIQCIFGFNI
jgi:hypothetical protein